MNTTIAHKFSKNHRISILNSGKCGCFYCGTLFEPVHISEWVNESTTAICPYCGIDSVLGDCDITDLNTKFLKEMYAHWFT